MPQRWAHMAVALLAAYVASCTAEGPTGTAGWVPSVGGRADGVTTATMARCWITTEGEAGFYQAHTLHCAPGEGASLSGLYVQVVGRNNSPWADLDLGDGEGSVRFYGDSYPLRVQARASLEGIFGQDVARIRTDELSVASAEELASPHSIPLPFDLWTMAVENRTTSGRLALDAYEVELDGGTFERAGSSSRTMPIAASASLRAGEVETFLVAVTRGTEALTGIAQGVPFTIAGGGAFVLTGDGLVPSTDIEPAPTGEPLASCSFVAADEEQPDRLLCRVTARPGIAIGNASLSVDGTTHALPVDGSETALAVSGPGPIEATLSASIEGGIEGLCFGGTPPPLEASAELRAGEQLDVTLPVALLSARFVPSADVREAYFDIDFRSVRFSRPWGGLYESTTCNDSAVISADDPSLLVAVDEGTTSLAGHLTIMATSYAVTEAELTVEDGGEYLLDTSGAAPLTAPEPGTLLASCWIDEERKLTCVRDAMVLSATLSIFIESFDRTIDRSLGSGEHAILTVDERLLPMVVTLSVEAPGAGAPIAVERRIESPTDLPETEPLSVVAG